MQIGEFRFLHESVGLCINIHILAHDLIHTLANLILSLLITLSQLFRLQVNAVLKEFWHWFNLPISLLRLSHESVTLLHLHFWMEQARRLLGLIQYRCWIIIGILYTLLSHVDSILHVSDRFVVFIWGSLYMRNFLHLRWAVLLSEGGCRSRWDLIHSTFDNSCH